MAFGENSFEINGHILDWGTTIVEIHERFGGRNIMTGTKYWHALECPCSNVAGLPTVRCELRSPGENKPVMRVRYQLGVQKPAFYEKVYSPYLKRLIQVLGNPSAKNDHTEDLMLMTPSELRDAVALQARWITDSALIHLTVYVKPQGKIAAEIDLEWTNVIKAAEPYLQKLLDDQGRFNNGLTDKTPIQKFAFVQPIRGIEPLETNPAKQSELYQASRLALYKKEMYKTPPEIGDRLQENEACLVETPAKQTMVASKFFMAPIAADGTFADMRPARGPGGRFLTIGDMKFEDDCDSQSILSMVKALEKKGVAFYKYSEYDF